MDYLKLFQTHAEYEDFVSGGTMMKPNVSHCIQENEVHYNPHTFADEYFTTIARENGTISFNILKSMGTDMITSMSYSTDNGETWTTTQNQNDKEEHLVINVNVSEGDKVLWKGNATQLGYFDEDGIGADVGSFFSSTCEFDGQGNVMSLLYGENFKGQITLEHNREFILLFCDYEGRKTCGIVNTKNLSLPATTLSQGCYSDMFLDCRSLTTAPELPATTLARGCYGGMFQDCTSLTTAPELPATTLAAFCYENMFNGCTSLQTAPELPATTSPDYCYSNMFSGCTSLETAPSILPATTLAEGCYDGMFADCTSLTTAPELSATTLAAFSCGAMFYGCTSLATAPELPAITLSGYCYENMFSGCTSLNYIKCLATDISASDCTKNWVSGVASSGTFTKAASMSSWTTGDNGIPTGWTIQDA